MMFRGLFAASLTLLVVTATGAAQAQTTPLFLLDSEAGVSTLIFQVDPASGALTTVGSLPIGFGEALGLAAQDDSHLVVTTESGAVVLVTVSPFSFTNLGTVLGRLVGLAFARTGELYAVDEGSEELSRITLAPLSKIVIGPVRSGSPAGPVLDVSGGDIAQSAAGDWYLWSNAVQDLYSLDVGSAVAVQLDPGTQGLGTKTGLAFDYRGSGALYASSGPFDQLLTLNPLTGASLGSVSFCLTCPTVYDYRFGDLASPHCTDADHDGFSPDGGGCGPVDCADDNGAIHPGAAEVCNGVDDDCNDTVDDQPAASAACANACTLTAQCTSGACVTTPVNCDDGNPCSQDTCDEALGCQHADQPDGLSCSDGSVCTGEEICLGGQCSNAPNLDCDDGNDCTVDSCSEPNGCRNQPIPGCCTSDADCADVSACTYNEHCEAGSCISDVLACDDGNPCTSDSCNPAVGCVNIAVGNGQVCGDGDFCNGVETCQFGVCSAGTAPDCSDGNNCTTDSCDPQVGCTHTVMAGCCTTRADCNDGNLCNGTEVCEGMSHLCENPGGALLCTPGSRRDERTCAAEWFVDNPFNSSGLLSPDHACQQGDPSCDHDANPATCTFQVGVCLRVADPRLDPPCAPADIAHYTLYRPSLHRNPIEAGALLAALDALPGSTISGPRQRDVDFGPAIDGTRCTVTVPIVVPVGKKFALRGRATTAGGVKDNDITQRLRCIAP
ncbi:MAG TPA: MopE-related protein [Candidatus Dormibacteraeota bacterium]|nr:MopE-related protein [Candidatus Dormibacteraeota bacterium]